MTSIQHSTNGSPHHAAGWLSFLRFAFVHSLRDMLRNRSRTFFALVCVATGVAAVVALRTLAFMVGDELTTNLAEVNRGDIRISASTSVPELIERSGAQAVFTQETLDVMQDWADREGIEMMVARMSTAAQIKPEAADGAAASSPGVVLYVEPERYPFYATIQLDAPAGMSFADALSVPEGSEMYPVVISKTLSRTTRLGLKVGDTLRIGGSETLFVVTGIANSEAESLFTVPQTAFLDYVYLPLDALPLAGEKPLPDTVFMKVPLEVNIAEAEKSLLAYLDAHMDIETDLAVELNVSSVPELEDQNEETASVLDDMILVMGLSSLLIGGIGIINTMLVVVSRRTLEIAVLKTLGLKAYRVTLLFLVEALLVGLLGSLMGMALGVVLSYLVRDVGETAFQVALEWRIYPVALWSGLFLGMVMTGLFGFLPTLIAGQVRPAIVLRPNEAQMPAAGLLQMLVTLVVMITVMGLLVDTIVEGALEYGPVYMIAGGGALVGLFAGIIIANTRLGKPIPVYMQFRLARRFERLERWIIGAIGLVVGWLPLRRWRDVVRPERGRDAIMIGVRTLRQTVLLYGALAVGAALASGIMLVASEVWLPFGAGEVKPANDIYYAAKGGDITWVVVWLLITLMIGGLIRWQARAFVSVIALSSLGVTLGLVFGWLGGKVLETALYGTGVWDVLAEMSTGVVLVEGALALLGAVYVGYWVLVWAVGKMPIVALLGIVSMVLVGLGAGIVAITMWLGRGAVLALVVLALAGWLAIRLRLGRRWMLRTGSDRAALAARYAGVAETAQATAHGASMMLLGVGLLGGGYLIAEALGNADWRIGLLLMLLLALMVWRGLRRSYSVDGRLILREMAGRRGRIASTLLGLSVGIAGLSLVSLTTGAVSNLLTIQLDQSTEGNLLVLGTRPEYSDDIGAALRDQPDVEHFSQLTAYTGELRLINGEALAERDPHRQYYDETDPDDEEMMGGDSGKIWQISERYSLDDLPDYQMEEGRALTPEDEGEGLVMIRQSFFTEMFDIHAGDQLTFLFANEGGDEDDVVMELRVIGIISRNSEQTGLEDLGNVLSVPPKTLSSKNVTPEAVFAIAQVDDTEGEALDRVKAAVTDVPGVIAFELSAITQLLENLIEQLKAIPTLVAWLALLAGTAIIANTVALATQERRRQIGVMKAVGVKGRRVLGMLIVENGLVGFIAGLIGVAVGFVATVVFVLASQSADQLQNTVEFPTMGWLLLMSIGVAIGAAALSAWSAAAEKPMNVLRYE